jgi:DNA polymerase-3 subunit delta'
LRKLPAGGGALASRPAGAAARGLARRPGLGWPPEGEEGGEERSGKKKPSKDIRVEEVRAAIALALTTSSRGRGKAIVIHPAERMNPIAANAFLKTLEEPAGNARFVLCTSAPDACCRRSAAAARRSASPCPRPRWRRPG